MPALIIEHERAAPAGYLDEWLEERGIASAVHRIDVDARNPDPTDHELIVTLGSESAAYDDTVPWLARELALLRGAAQAGVPTLGICFGSQCLARALGGRAMRAPQAEIGWLRVRTLDPAVVEAGPWFQWHYDTFQPPPGAVVHAESDVGTQSFTLGRSFAVQFHPEVTPPIAEVWVRAGLDAMLERGIDPERVLAETWACAGEARAAAFGLFDAFLERAAGALEPTPTRASNGVPVSAPAGAPVSAPAGATGVSSGP